MIINLKPDIETELLPEEGYNEERIIGWCTAAANLKPPGTIFELQRTIEPNKYSVFVLVLGKLQYRIFNTEKEAKHYRMLRGLEEPTSTITTSSAYVSASAAASSALSAAQAAIDAQQHVIGIPAKPVQPVKITTGQPTYSDKLDKPLDSNKKEQKKKSLWSRIFGR